MQERVALTKAQRLHRICHLLYRNPRGLTTSEMARLCGVSKRTAQRDVLDLEEGGVPVWDDEGNPPRYGIIGGYYLPPIHLNLDDALALYLAGRLLGRYADSYDPHVLQALAKLAGILPESVATHIHATVRTLVTRPQDERFIHVLAVLALGWASQRKVRMEHRASGSDNVHQYTLSPYFIEPSAPGNATYVIGHASFFDEVHTFKIERILKAELLPERFEVPEGFDGPELLNSAWGIMYGEESVEVQLRFASSATRRIKETRWHPSQRLDDLPNGGCVLRLDTAHPEEMIYWIRGWGPQVEVVEPLWLREKMAREAGEMALIYGNGR